MLMFLILAAGIIGQAIGYSLPAYILMTVTLGYFGSSLITKSIVLLVCAASIVKWENDKKTKANLAKRGNDSAPNPAPENSSATSTVKKVRKFSKRIRASVMCGNFRSLITTSPVKTPDEMSFAPDFEVGVVEAKDEYLIWRNQAVGVTLDKFFSLMDATTKETAKTEQQHKLAQKELTDKIAQLTSELALLTTHHNETKNLLADAKNQVDELQSTANQLNAANDEHVAKHAENAQLMTDVKEELKNIGNVVSELQIANLEHIDRHSETKKLMESANNEANKFQKLAQEFKEQNKELITKANESQKLAQEFEEQNKELITKANKFEKRAQEFEEQNKELVTKQNDERKLMASEIQAIQNIASESENLNKENAAKYDQAQELLAEKSKEVEEMKQKINELQTVQNENVKLRDEQKQKDQIIQGLSEQLSAAENDLSTISRQQQVSQAMILHPRPTKDEDDEVPSSDAAEKISRLEIENSQLKTQVCYFQDKSNGFEGEIFDLHKSIVDGLACFRDIRNLDDIAVRELGYMVKDWINGREFWRRNHQATTEKLIAINNEHIDQLERADKALRKTAADHAEQEKQDKKTRAAVRKIEDLLEREGMSGVIQMQQQMEKVWRDYSSVKRDKQDLQEEIDKLHKSHCELRTRYADLFTESSMLKGENARLSHQLNEFRRTPGAATPSQTTSGFGFTSPFGAAPGNTTPFSFGSQSNARSSPAFPPPPSTPSSSSAFNFSAGGQSRSTGAAGFAPTPSPNPFAFGFQGQSDEVHQSVETGNDGEGYGSAAAEVNEYRSGFAQEMDIDTENHPPPIFSPTSPVDASSEEDGNAEEPVGRSESPLPDYEEEEV